MREGDVAAVLAIAARSPEAAQWSRGEYERACHGGFDGWVASVGQHAEDIPVGFLVARGMADEMEVLNLAVEASWRRRGVASGLLEAALAFGRASGAKSVFVEVRRSNAGALAFYERFGFAWRGVRPHYYADPPEDALVLFRELS